MWRSATHQRRSQRRSQRPLISQLAATTQAAGLPYCHTPAPAPTPTPTPTPTVVPVKCVLVYADGQDQILQSPVTFSGPPPAGINGDTPIYEAAALVLPQDLNQLSLPVTVTFSGSAGTVYTKHVALNTAGNLVVVGSSAEGATSCTATVTEGTT